MNEAIIKNYKMLTQISKNAESEVQSLGRLFTNNGWMDGNEKEKRERLENHYGKKTAKMMKDECGSYSALADELKKTYDHARAEYNLARLAIQGKVKTHFESMMWRINEWERMVDDFSRNF